LAAIIVPIVVILAGAAVAQGGPQRHGLAHGAQVAPLSLNHVHALLHTGGIAVRGLPLLRLVAKTRQALGALPVANGAAVELLQQRSGCPRGGQACVRARGIRLLQGTCFMRSKRYSLILYD